MLNQLGEYIKLFLYIRAREIYSLFCTNGIKYVYLDNFFKDM